MALNYIHKGCRPLSVATLGRRPSLAQLNIYRPLRAKLAACDQPGGEYPLPPGRSGFEFIARLVELEKFSVTCPAFDFSYDGMTHQSEAENEKVGTILEAHRFNIEENFSPLQPYRSVDASRLKLCGLGQCGICKNTFIAACGCLSRILAYYFMVTLTASLVLISDVSQKMRI